MLYLVLLSGSCKLVEKGLKFGVRQLVSYGVLNGAFRV